MSLEVTPRQFESKSDEKNELSSKLRDTRNKENVQTTPDQINTENKPSLQNGLKQTQKILKQLPPLKNKISNIEDCLLVKSRNIDFGNLFPGMICEDEIDLIPKTSETLIVQLLILCRNKEYEQLDEYVYSARKITGYEYNEKIIVALSGRNPITLKIAIKVPNIKNSDSILGIAIIQAANLDCQPFNGQINIPISTNIVIPKLLCTKQLFLENIQQNVIRVAAKFNKNSDCKIPFKNQTQASLLLEVDFLIKDDTQPFTIQSNSNMNVQANSPCLLVFQVKPKFGQYAPVKELEYKEVLVLKVKNSSIYFSFPLMIKFY